MINPFEALKSPARLTRRQFLKLSGTVGGALPVLIEPPFSKFSNSYVDALARKVIDKLTAYYQTRGKKRPILDLKGEKLVLRAGRDTRDRYEGIGFVATALNPGTLDTLLAYEATVSLPIPGFDIVATREIHLAKVTNNGEEISLGDTIANPLSEGYSKDEPVILGTEEFFRQKMGSIPDQSGFLRRHDLSGHHMVKDPSQENGEIYHYPKLFSPQLAFNPETNEFILVFSASLLDLKSLKLSPPIISISRVSTEGRLLETHSIADSSHPSAKKFQYSPSLAINNHGEVAIAWIEADYSTSPPSEELTAENVHFNLLVQRFDPYLRPSEEPPVRVFQSLGQDKEDYLQNPGVAWAGTDNESVLTIAHYPYIDEKGRFITNIYGANLTGKVRQINNNLGGPLLNTGDAAFTALPTGEVALAYPYGQGVGFDAFNWQGLNFQLISSDLEKRTYPQGIHRGFTFAPQMATLNEYLVITALTLQARQQEGRRGKTSFLQRGIIVPFDPQWQGRREENYSLFLSGQESSQGIPSLVTERNFGWGFYTRRLTDVVDEPNAIWIAGFSLRS